jgi:hypothetical protein
MVHSRSKQIQPGKAKGAPGLAFENYRDKKWSPVGTADPQTELSKLA